MKLTVHEAAIHTATVEIKTLTISGKQVTLAVFRQLKVEHLIGGAGLGLLGVPWGWVNYHADRRCHDWGHHLHIVWQKGSELRVCKVYESVSVQPWYVRSLDRPIGDTSTENLTVRYQQLYLALTQLPQLFIAV